MAKVLALVADLLYGSNVQGQLQAAGHDVELVTDEAQARARTAAADVLVVDLASGQIDGAGLLGRLREHGELGGVRTLACYSHVEADTRTRAQQAGFDLVVPRSRMAREGAALVTRLADDRPPDDRPSREPSGDPA
jgi:CheY-like chemotaxis protein